MSVAIINETGDKMKDNFRPDFYRHLAFAAVGGFFGAYAILCRCGMLASAQTMNLLHLTIAALQGDVKALLLYFGAFVLYVVGMACTVLVPHYLHIDIRRAVPFVDIAAALVLTVMSPDINVILGLYPIFFAMSLQWCAFSGANGYVSATIFSTNNTKQATLALSEYITDGDKRHFGKMWFYVFTLLVFHVGAAVSFFAVKLMNTRGAWMVIPLALLAYFTVLNEDKANKKQAV